MTKPLILGTRGSDLALAQSRMVQEALMSTHTGLVVQLKIITTTGDAQTSMPLDEPTAEGAGLFTKQLEGALLNAEIDLAVHSLKDLPVETPSGLCLAAILPRAPTGDLLVSRHQGGLSVLPPGAVIGTSSPRRALLLKNRRPDLVMTAIRGNVPTRLQKVTSAESYDATILASAGLLRLGQDLSWESIEINGCRLWIEHLSWMLPAPGQGAIAVEMRDDNPSIPLISTLHDTVTARCVETERLVLRHLGGGCHLALGALATESCGMIHLQAVFVSEENAQMRSATASATNPGEAARLVADQLMVL